MGNFEIDNTAYPIGYLSAAGDHQVFDMRSLTPLHSHSIPKADAVRIAAEANRAIREKRIAFGDNTAEAKQFVESKVSAL